MKTISERLRAMACYENDDLTIGDEAADEIERLTKMCDELSASPLSEEALDILRSKNRRLADERDDARVEARRQMQHVETVQAERDEWRNTAEHYSKDVVMLEKERQEFAAQVEAIRKSLYSLGVHHPDEDDCQVCKALDLAYSGAARILAERDAQTIEWCAVELAQYDSINYALDFLHRAAHEKREAAK
jgi:phosphoglycolate phosphatase-like HAD superfamily hydrolase